MQLGTRWAVGAMPPERLSPSVVLAIRDVEAQLAEVDTSQWRWTLTWLESRPVVELDDGTVIRVAADGTVTTGTVD
ncbi:MAG: hypothetical protein ACOH1J_01395 [Microbacteriaceae bacterium]